MSGGTDEAKGRLKKAVGEMTDNDRLEREGTMDKAAGKAKDAVDSVRDKAKDIVDHFKTKDERTA